MPIRLALPLPGPFVLMRRERPPRVGGTPPPKRPGDTAAKMWGVFGCVALACLAIAGAWTLWFLVPVGLVLAAGHALIAGGTPSGRRTVPAREQSTGRHAR